MYYSYNNSILIIVFTWARDCINKERINKLYLPYFKKIIFYSNIIQDQSIETEYSGIHYIDIRNGWYVIKLFEHLYNNYKDEIHNSDGLFYTMDDNILNLNLLKFYSNTKIIYPYENKVWKSSIPGHSDNHSEMMIVENHHGWHWSDGHKLAVNNLLDDPRFNKLKYGNKVRGQLGDYFYLPNRYLNSETFFLFKLFADHNIILEIAIPTIIRMIEPDEKMYNNFKSLELWGGYRDVLLNKDAMSEVFIRNLNLCVHPIKFNQNPKALDWLDDIFSKPRLTDKCVIITTINGITDTIQKHINSVYDVIIVGDKKTIDVFTTNITQFCEPTDNNKQKLKEKRCIYLDIELQDSLFGNLSRLIPYNHYGRKNLGYLYAISQGYTTIYETDDDNIPYDNFDLFPENIVELEDKNHRWINIFKYFTNGSHIWPRGYPLSIVKSEPLFYTHETNILPSIITGLVEGDPDVDAIFRLTCLSDVSWETNKAIVVSRNNICVFNTQNTFWIDPDIFISMIIPCSVTFRYCDILRGIITNVILKYSKKNLMYISPNVMQIRNEHNLIKDLESESVMYIENENILEYIEDGIHDSDTIDIVITKIYNNLLGKNIIKELDVFILKEWLTYFSDIISYNIIVNPEVAAHNGDRTEEQKQEILGMNVTKPVKKLLWNRR